MPLLPLSSPRFVAALFLAAGLSFGVAAAEDFKWSRTDTDADWTGRDLGYCSKGILPDKALCDAGHLGQVAECWLSDGCGAKGGWCAYKNVNPITPPDGKKPTYAFYCGSTSYSGSFIVVPHTFEMAEKGHFAIKTVKDMPFTDFRGQVMLGCGAFAQACTQILTAKTPEPFFATSFFASDNLQTTAYVDAEHSDAETTYAKFVAPADYSICKAKLDMRRGGIAADAAFKGMIQRPGSPGGDGLLLIAKAPKSRPSSQWIGFPVFVEYVRKEKIAQFDCWPDGAVVWDCADQKCAFHSNARL